MRRIGRWVTGPATLLASLLLSAVFAGAAFAAGVPPYVGSSPKGGKGIDRGQQLYQGPRDWTAAIVLLAIVVAAGVILVASAQLRERNARRAAAMTTPVTR